MIIAIIISVISITTAAGFGVYALRLRRQMIDICGQIRFIQEHDSNKKISTQMQDKAVFELAACVNELAEEKRRTKIQVQNNERIFKDTISGISHDIRTPLTSLFGYFQMLQTASDDTSRQKYMAIIDSRIRQLQDMTEQLFTFVKLENPSYVVEKERVNLTQILCDVMLAFYNDIELSGLKPTVLLPDDVIFVEANADALQRVLQNLIRNALVHGEHDLLVNVRITSKFIRLTVGNQISAGQQIDTKRVFDRFYKADASRHSGSTGLGLFIAKSLTQRMGGKIRAIAYGGLFCVILSFKRIG